MKLSAQIESILFWKAEPVSVKKIAEYLAVNQEMILPALVELIVRKRSSTRENK